MIFENLFQSKFAFFGIDRSRPFYLHPQFETVVNFYRILKNRILGWTYFILNTKTNGSDKNIKYQNITLSIKFHKWLDYQLVIYTNIIGRTFRTFSQIFPVMELFTKVYRQMNKYHMRK